MREDGGIEMCAVDELPVDRPQLVVSGTFRATLVRTEDGVHALSATCPHRGAPLYEGSIHPRVDADVPGQMTVDDSTLLMVCPWHRWEFRLDTGEALRDDRCVRIYHTEIEDETVVVYPRRRASDVQAVPSVSAP